MSDTDNEIGLFSAVPDPSGGKLHPAWGVMIKRAINGLRMRNGAPRKSINRYIHAHYAVVRPCNKTLSRFLKRMVARGYLSRESGRFKLTAKGRRRKRILVRHRRRHRRTRRRRRRPRRRRRRARKGRRRRRRTRRRRRRRY